MADLFNTIANSGVSGIAGAGSTIAGGIASIANLLVVSPSTTVGYQPQSVNPGNGSPPTQLPALVFNYEGENTATIESDITDHFAENNTSIQDMIALRPVTITTQGFIGELNNVPPNKYFAALQVAAQKLTAVGAYAPSLSTSALIAYNEAAYAYSTGINTYNSAVSAFNSITGNGGESVIGSGVANSTGVSSRANQTKQALYFQQFYGYWYQRTLFTIQTPWAVFTDMAIKSLRAIQSAETNVITDFEITFKQIRYASVTTNQTLYSDNTSFQSRLYNQGAASTPLGTSNLTESSTSFASVLGVA